MALLSSRLSPLTVSVPAMSEWVSYTPTWSSSGTQPVLGNGNISAWWRRVGDSVEIRINTTFGSTTTYGTGNWKFSTPASLVIDTTKLFNATNIGSGIAYDSSALSSKALTARYDGSTDGIRLFSPEGTNGVVTNTSPFIWATADEINITITLPITGWTSHTAAATSANALVVGGQSVGSTLSFGATSNQGFSILANNVSVLSSTAAGAVTIGPDAKNVNHVVNGRRITLTADNSDSGNSRFFMNIGDATTNGTTFSSVNAILAAAGEDTGTTAVMQFQSDIGTASAITTRPIFEWRNYNTQVGVVSAAGAWTLGPISTGSVSVPTATATTLFALDQTAYRARTLLITAHDNGATHIGGYAMILVLWNGGVYTYQISQPITGANGGTFSISGNNLQITHSFGSTRTVSYRVVIV